MAHRNKVEEMNEKRIEELKEKRKQINQKDEKRRLLQQKLRDDNSNKLNSVYSIKKKKVDQKLTAYELDHQLKIEKEKSKKKKKILSKRKKELLYKKKEKFKH